VEDKWLKSSPSVYGQRVAWTGYSDGAQADLYLFDIETGLIRRLAQTAASELSPVLSAGRLLWVRRTDCDVNVMSSDGKPNIPETGVYVLGLDTGVEQKLTDYVEPVAFFDQDTVLVIEGCQVGFQAYVISLR